MEKLPAQMTVIGISKPGGPEVLVPETRPVPAPGPNEILIKVAAAGVNRPDVAQRSGSYPPPPGASDLPGLEVAGEVVALGTGASKYKLGDKVMSLVSGGGYAQYCIAHESIAMPVPAGLSITEAGATPETLMTVWHNVFERGGLKAGETLLIHGGSSGIGTMAIQLAKAFGAKVIVSVGSQDKADACLKLGADHAINHRTEDVASRVAEITGGSGVDLVLNAAGGESLNRQIAMLAPFGLAVSYGKLEAPLEESLLAALDRGPGYLSSPALRFFTMHTFDDKPEYRAESMRYLIDRLAAGDIRPLIHARLPLKDARRAHEMLEAREVIGGLFVLEATNYDEVVALCRDCPHLDFGTIEIRQVEPTG